LDKVLSAAMAVIVPVVGLALRASRRSRLLKRVEEYRNLAEQLRATDQATATELDALQRETVHALVRMDKRTLHRRVDPSAVLALLFLLAPAAAGFVLALGWDSAWKWPALIFAGLWFVVWLGVGLTQLWKEGEEETE
jgi:hypothetical protein